MKDKKTIISKKSIIKELKEFAARLERSPTWAECVSSTEISMVALKKHFETYNKALAASKLKINRIKSSYRKRLKPSGTHKRKYQLHEPRFTLRFCNVCENKFKAEDNMRSCPSCTIAKSGSDNSCCFSELPLA